jgi:hypothetical protein
VAHSVEIALAQLRATSPAGTDEPPFRTHRYLMGSEERMERSQRVAGGCGRVVLRTLRGTLISAAVAPPADRSPCTGSYQLDP